ncbi:hypothetical protein JV173_00960 [Acholeplasma equirhinis]|uniref:zinc ribbon domain-containing protein n=1 Tax=Acholeplasma equirhinis TaxID=555393 RepID=UPI00197AF9C1|nr:zinc ribbon domain-containing protein [Acholeplasma equirhinis]MBN3490074.1 hypothetical protein [Acholeplasma equirhinis]
MMKCIKCGYEMKKISTFCPDCGWDQRKDPIVDVKNDFVKEPIEQSIKEEIEIIEIKQEVIETKTKPIMIKNQDRYLIINHLYGLRLNQLMVYDLYKRHKKFQSILNDVYRIKKLQLEHNVKVAGLFKELKQTYNREILDKTTDSIFPSHEINNSSNSLSSESAYQSPFKYKAQKNVKIISIILALVLAFIGLFVALITFAYVTGRINSFSYFELDRYLDNPDDQMNIVGQFIITGSLISIYIFYKIFQALLLPRLYKGGGHKNYGTWYLNLRRFNQQMIEKRLKTDEDFQLYLMIDIESKRKNFSKGKKYSESKIRKLAKKNKLEKYPYNFDAQFSKIILDYELEHDLKRVVKDARDDLESINQKTALIYSLETTILDTIQIYKTEIKEMYKKIEDTYKEILHPTDWESVDTIIFYLETGRAENLKEALILLQHRQNAEMIADVIRQSAEYISQQLSIKINQLENNILDALEEQRAYISNRFDEIDGRITEMFYAFSYIEQSVEEAGRTVAASVHSASIDINQHLTQLAYSNSESSKEIVSAVRSVQ